MIKEIITTTLIYALTAPITYPPVPQEVMSRYPNNIQVILQYPINGETVLVECGKSIPDFFKINHTYEPNEGLIRVNLHPPKGTYQSSFYSTGKTLNTRVFQEGTHYWNIGHNYTTHLANQAEEYGKKYYIHTELQHFNVKCINSETTNTEEDLEQFESVKEKQEDKTEEEKVKDKINNTFKQIVKGVKTTTKEIFNWNTKDIENLVLAYLNLTYKVADSQKVTTNQLQKKEIKSFIFPFKKIIGVTQWHGNTAFQQPHTGIDFGATKETIISPGDGTVIAKGYDTFNGECFSGGNYLIIKHTNGMYTSYMHLEQTLVNINDEIDKGQEIAISGNSGQWNCQNLKYHLHFETRTNRSQSTHVNPVDYIETDWDQIITLNSENIPARLSGDNPHPTY